MRFYKAAIAAIAVNGALAQPASALEEYRFENTQSDGEHTIAQQAFFQMHPAGDGTATVAFECYAKVEPLAAAIGFKSCYIEGRRTLEQFHASTNTTDATYGPAKATGQVVVNATYQRYRICIRTSAFFIQESEHFETALACSPYRP